MSKKSLKFLNNASENTCKTYNGTVKKYEEYHKMDIDSLVCEALDEQEKGVPQHRLTIIERLEGFQEHLKSQGLVYGTISNHMTKVKTIYKKNRVMVPYIEPLNAKKALKREYLEYKDILTKEELKEALPHMRLPIRARAMAVIQGGLSNEECEHLTTRCFIDGLKQYHQCDDDVEALRWLADEHHPVIWAVRLVRVKTGKPYYALIGSEAVNTIAMAKLYEMKLPSNKGEIPAKLLTSHKLSFNRACVVINDKLGLGYVGQIHHREMTDSMGNIHIPRKLFSRLEMVSDIEYNIIKTADEVIISTNLPNAEIEYMMGGECKLTPHKIRKFHATYIRGGLTSSTISNSEIDEMQGRGKTAVQDTYIKTNPVTQKVLYAQVMNNLSLYHQYEFEVTDDDVVVSLVDAVDLQKKVKSLSSQLQKKKMASEKVDALRKELGDDVLLELMQGILNAS